MKRFALLCFGAVPMACVTTPDSSPGYLGIEKVSLLAKGME